MGQEVLLIVIAAAALVVILLLLLLARGRRQHVRFDPPAPAATLRERAPAPPPAPAAQPAEPAPAIAADADAGADAAPLTRLKGLGPKAAARLGELGITGIDQIAAWSEADAARIDQEMGPFKGRIARDRWVEQARLLAGGDIAAYEAEFGKLGG